MGQKSSPSRIGDLTPAICFSPRLHLNKKHLCYNLKEPEGKEIFLRLAETADLIIERFRSGVAERLVIDYGTLNRMHPELIYYSITGYGQMDQYRDRAGHEIKSLRCSYRCQSETAAAHHRGPDR